MSPDPSRELEPKDNGGYRDRHLVRPPQEAGRETAAGRVGPVGTGGAESGAGGGAERGGDAAVYALLGRGFAPRSGPRLAGKILAWQHKLGHEWAGLSNLPRAFTH